MRKIQQFVLLLAVLTLLAMPVSNAQAVQNSTDFETFTPLTAVEDLNIGGVTFTSTVSGEDAWVVDDFTGVFVRSSTNVLIGVDSITLDFDEPVTQVAFTYAIPSLGTDLTIETQLNGVVVGASAFEPAIPSGGTFPEGAVTINGEFDRLIIDTFTEANPTQSSTAVIDNLSFTSEEVIPVGYVQEGLFRISEGIQPSFSAGGPTADLAPGVPLILPADADGNGFDDYAVTDIQVVDGVAWYALFTGSFDRVWVPETAGEFRINP